MRRPRIHGHADGVAAGASVDHRGAVMVPDWAPEKEPTARVVPIPGADARSEMRILPGSVEAHVV
jgi:hypothetical protein